MGSRAALEELRKEAELLVATQYREASCQAAAKRHQSSAPKPSNNTAREPPRQLDKSPSDNTPTAADDDFFGRVACFCGYGGELDPSGMDEVDNGGDVMMCARYEHCFNAICNQCYLKAHTALPSEDQEYWCPLCCVNCKTCAEVVDINTPAVLCRTCSSCFHKQCIATDLAQHTPWDCPACRCVVCKTIKRLESAVECTTCATFFHVDCDADCDQEHVLCGGCFKLAIAAGGYVEDGVLHPFPAPLPIDQDTENDDEDFGQGLDPPAGSDYLDLVQSWRGFSGKHPIKAMVLALYARDGTLMTGAKYELVCRAFAKALKCPGEALQELLRRGPPLKLSRQLRSIIQLEILQTELTVVENGYEVSCQFHHRPLRRVVEEIYLSAACRRTGTFYQAQKGGAHCQAGRQFGTRIPDLVEAFAKDKGVDLNDPSNVILVARLFCDKATTKFYSSYPAVLSIANFDVDARNLVLSASQFLAAFPVRAVLSFARREEDGTKTPVSTARAFAAKVDLNLALKRLARKALRVILREFKELEVGFSLALPGGKVLRVFVLLGQLLMDMEEKRTILDLRPSTSWACGHCYWIAGQYRSFDDEAELKQLADDCGVARDKLLHRTLSTDAELRSKLGNAGDDTYSNRESREKTGAELLAQLGMKPRSDCALLDNNGQPICYLLGGDPASVFQIDILHAQAGAADRFYEATRCVFGPEMVRKSHVLGNVSHEIPNGVSYYRFEAKSRDLFYVAVATANSVPTASVRPGACEDLLFGFLLFNGCAKDDFPGLVAELLKDSISLMERGIRDLESIYRKNTGKDMVTCKIHTLLKHSQQDLVLAGPLKVCSTYDGESMHTEGKNASLGSTQRTGDRANAMIYLTGVSRVFENIDTSAPRDYRDGKEFQEADSKWFDEVKIKLGDFGPAMRLCKTNVANLAKIIGEGSQEKLDELFSDENIAKGLIERNIVSIGRSVLAKGICTISGVTRKSQASFAYGTVWSYSNGVPEVLGTCTRQSPCRAHTPGCELFPSLKRTLDSSKFGFPVLLVKNSAGERSVWMMEFNSEAAAVDWRYGQICKRFEATFRATKVSLDRLRDFHLWCHCDGRFYVHAAGSRSFDHS